MGGSRLREDIRGTCVDNIHSLECMFVQTVVCTVCFVCLKTGVMCCVYFEYWLQIVCDMGM